MEYIHIILSMVFDYRFLIFYAFLSCFSFFCFFKTKFTPQTKSNMHFLRILPELLQNWHRLLLWVTSIQLETNGSFMIKGPWFSKLEILCSADPADVQYIMSKRFTDFHKGSNFNEIFDVFGDGIFNAEGDRWKYQKKIAHSTFISSCFQRFMADTVKGKLENGLIPLLEQANEQGIVVDLQDLFTRFTSDVTFITIMDYDPCSLSLTLPENPVSNYFHDVEHVLFMRHLLPQTLWKLQRWLKIGKDKSMKKTVEATERILFNCIAQRKEEVEKTMEQVSSDNLLDVGTMSLLGLYIMHNYGTPDHGFQSTTKFLRDTLATYLSAGQDTTSSALTWFFWLLSENPRVQMKIKQELQEKLHTKTYDFPKVEEINKLVYLHAAICESLRLYPPVPLNHKASHHSILLPSGYKVNPWTIIILNCYAMGRMRSIWGDDCMEFKPERWITQQGTIKYEPSHKFFVFNAGPRICLGKEIALMQMKMVIANIFLHNIHFQVLEGQSIEPAFSIVLSMKHGLKVRVFKK